MFIDEPDMTSEEIQQATFKAYVIMARLLKNQGIPTWTIYVFRAEEILKKMNNNRTNVIDMADFVKAA